MRLTNIQKMILTMMLSVVNVSYAETTSSPLVIQPSTVIPAKAALGKQLFHDKRLSADNTVSCASCHDLKKGGTDQLPVSVGIKGQKGSINAPTVLNSEHNFVQFWDGRAQDLKAQAMGPVENPKEMGEQWPNVVKKIQANPSYVKQFTAVFAGVISNDTIAEAIAEFEKTLSTPGSAFDRYVSGDKKALSPVAQKGYELFQQKGCVACHTGAYFGGQMYQRLNPDYFKDRGTPMTDADLGRYNVTHVDADKHMFKVPMLRNVAVTPPYFHDGQVKNLDDAVVKMAKYQLGLDLKPEEVKALVVFLQSLNP